MQIVQQMPALPYDFGEKSFHYTLVEDMVILVCTERESRSTFLRSHQLATTSLTSRRFWHTVRTICAFKRTVYSMVSRYRNYWEDLNPSEIPKFLPYLKAKNYDYVVKLIKDPFDSLTYVDSIVDHFYQKNQLSVSKCSSKEIKLQQKQKHK
jgi:hypothetical protein